MLNEFNYRIIRSGSKGNAVILGRNVMVDCGVPWKVIKDLYKEIVLVLLTHIHRDHFNRASIHRLAAERPLLRFACGRWMVIPLLDCGIEAHRIDILESGKVYSYKGLCEIEPVALVHDVPNMGFKVHIQNKKVFYATDTANLNGISAPNYDLYLLEANYGEEEIKNRISEKKCNGEYAYERRVEKTHLSVEQCNDFIYSNIGSSGEYVYLHQHES